MRPLPFLAAALLATAAAAQGPSSLPGTPDPTKATGGSYAIEPSHTQIVFAVDHMGFSIFRGFLSQASGSLMLDPAKPAATQLSVTITPGPSGLATVEGNLTLHGITKPARMQVHFRGAGANPMSKATTIGFDGHLTVERSQFGVTKYVPLVSDRVDITIAAAFEKQ